MENNYEIHLFETCDGNWQVRYYVGCHRLYTAPARTPQEAMAASGDAIARFRFASLLNAQEHPNDRSPHHNCG